VAPGWTERLSGSACRLGIPAAQLAIAEAADSRHALPVTADQIELLGHVRVVRLLVGQELVAVAVPPERSLQLGQKL
jgi:hypothetical protein